MSYENFMSWGLRVSQEFHDQYSAESENEQMMKISPPAPFLQWTEMKNFLNG